MKSVGVWVLVSVVAVCGVWIASSSNLIRDEMSSGAKSVSVSPDELFVEASRRRPHKKRVRGSGVVETFEAAHRVLPQIHGPAARTIYCGCLVQGNKIDLASCGYRVHKNRRRAERLEWEHVVPAHAFGQAFAEWREGSPACARKGKKSRGRNCARTNHDFNLMESDLYNLWPEIGELNGLRNNFSMAEIAGRGLTFGACTAKIADKKFEPMEFAKGTVARVYMYMDWKYPGRGIISEKNRPLFDAWDKQHPITEHECEVGRRVFAIQQNANPVLASRCKVWPKGGTGPLRPQGTFASSRAGWSTAYTVRL